MRVVRTLLVGTVALTPALTLLTALRPVAAETAAPFGSFGLTVTSAAVRTAGDVGASGGLVKLGNGTAVTGGRRVGATG
jgi:hypothetical protein